MIDIYVEYYRLSTQYFYKIDLIDFVDLTGVSFSCTEHCTGGPY
jgi:hypothetical protein